MKPIAIIAIAVLLIAIVPSLADNGLDYISLMRKAMLSNLEGNAHPILTVADSRILLKAFVNGTVENQTHFDQIVDQGILTMHSTNRTTNCTPGWVCRSPTSRAQVGEDCTLSSSEPCPTVCAGGECRSVID